MESSHNISKKVKDSSAGKDMSSEYIRNVKLQVEELVLIKFPQIALELDELLKAFIISDDICATRKELKLVPDPSRNPDIDEFISKLQKLTVASFSGSNRTHHVQCNECAGNSDHYNSSDVSATHNELKILVPNHDLRNPDIEECSKIEKLGDISESSPSNFGNIQCKRSEDINNFHTDVSAHNELKMLVKEQENFGTDKCFSKIPKLRATSDSVLNHFDNIRFDNHLMDAIYFNSAVSENNGLETLKHPPSSNSDIYECISEIEKLKTTLDSVPNGHDYIRCNESTVDANNFSTNVSAHNELKTSDQVSSHPDNEFVPKEPKSAVVSDSVQSFTDRIQCKKHMSDMIQLMKLITQRFLEDIQLLKMWIQFLTPQKEETVDLMETILNDILLKVLREEIKALELNRRIQVYFSHRCIIIRRYMKYPQVEDYLKALQELDEEYYCDIRHILCEFKSFYLTFHDVVSKNLNRLKKPRSFNPATMY